MRFLSFHCDYFKYITTNRSRSKIFEDLTEENKSGEIEDVLVLFISIEKDDEHNPKILEDSYKSIKKITNQLKVKNIVLLSFAHLFGELSSPQYALNLLNKLEKLMKENEFEVLKPPFGWFNELELKAKGHPLSRMSRRIP